MKTRALTLHQWLRERSSALQYTYAAYIVMWSHLCLRLPNGFVTSGFAIKSVWAFLHPVDSWTLPGPGLPGLISVA
jgi:hypothetical protein